MPPVDGSGVSGVCLLGEAWGEKEAARGGTPFVGPVGFRLERMVQQLGASRADFLITNVAWFQPPGNREPTELEVEQWRPQWESAIRSANIKVVVPLGNIPLRAVLGHWGIQRRRGYLEWSERLGCWVLPTVHPSFIVRGNANWTAAWLRDVGMALEVAQNGPPCLPERQLLLDPAPGLAYDWAAFWEAAGRPPLAFDIETPDKSNDEEESKVQAQRQPQGTILRIGLSYVFGGCTQAISVPWGAGYLKLVSVLLRTAPISLVWNRHFDVPRLRAYHVVFQAVHDVQEMWHLFHTDLKKSLEFVCPFLVPAQPYWKDQAMLRPAYYNAIDAAVTAEAYEVLWGKGLEGGTVVSKVPVLPPAQEYDQGGLSIPF